MRSCCRILTFAIAFAAFASNPGQAQRPDPPPPVIGVDYSFERVTTIRQVNDEHDRGPVSLVSFIYRPLKKNNGVVVLALHGSTGGVASPAEPPFPRHLVPIGPLLEQGFTIVAPQRRGRGESGGRFVEECFYEAGECSLADYRTISERGLEDALASTDAVFKKLVLAKLRPPNGKILLLGLSRGGFVALHFAAAHPRNVLGVIAVSPGLLSVSDKWPEKENRQRLATLEASLSRVAAAYKGPTLWIYAARDPFYRESVPPQLFSSFQRAGGRGEYFSIAQHSLPSGHVPPPDLWWSTAQRFLKSIESGKADAPEVLDGR